ncbi:FtsK/SpoIIIE domain-containing protein [Mycobacterium sp. 1423905.2]|uniref:FtsK/SpoIIIE domain-containing protein n=1 Tax=Mycobacterium sp. 1423905.2 TaxID=1856859 RepID=UPI00273857C7|nr:FtsK/SpoIIIE domain-containing protein [Mycobacterium sp. 1423905.2]
MTAPPEVPRSVPSGVLLRLVPVGMSVATIGVMAAALASGSPVARSPTFLAFPAMMLGSLLVSVLGGRGRHDIVADRLDYLDYLSGLRGIVADLATAQHVSLADAHPDPYTLWTLIGGARMWARRPGDPQFYHVRVGRGSRPLATRLTVPPGTPACRPDPVTDTALRRFLRAHSTLVDAPIAIPLDGPMTIDGDPTTVRALLRAMVCQLAVLHAPDQALIAAVVCEGSRAEWDWLKWLPHNQGPVATAAADPAPMVFSTLEQAHLVLGEAASAAVVIVDSDEHDDCRTGRAILRVGVPGGPPTIRRPDQTQTLDCPDQMSVLDAVVCARRLAAHIPSARGGVHSSLWEEQDDRLCVSIGLTPEGMAVELDIKESAEGGMGPHGLCVGATGSGKSELLRTVALGMMARNSPAVLNLLLVDFKGGATFLDKESQQVHVMLQGCAQRSIHASATTRPAAA